MFKKLIVGALATGIALTGGSSASAAAPNVDVVKTDNIQSLYIRFLDEHDFGGYKSRWDIPATREWDGVTWYLKGATLERDETWTGHYEGWRVIN
ncbi:LCI fold-containing protein [Bacillus toyonensis]|uniref:LCI fold domain-containing protein n=1 Tax=Bacillus toyonensis TaxID=155322 RepID=A0AB73QS99_9BACI|nr:LCI fold-containing protein [Bacillus toyonensis]PEI82469.1 hypothetical protein CN678_28395 [Bacillus toyonensis]PEK39420.1 hypothetical protein CN586_28685 [Bacillus toyonensis]PEL50525.1 hypothetical protein CN638_17925 [Bacillus toyonensis]PEM36768.1 hypothetical protein CN636_30885 [Bacillus toyonensis]PEM87448.1 hypothetical protein CN629_24380 [Bacillus toyonensis]